jgi:hypothetical protein
VYVGDKCRARQGQEVIVAAQVRRVVGETFAAVIRLVEPGGLDHGPHGAVDEQDTLPEGVAKPRVGVLWVEHGCRVRVVG